MKKLLKYLGIYMPRRTYARVNSRIDELRDSIPVRIKVCFDAYSRQFDEQLRHHALNGPVIGAIKNVDILKMQDDVILLENRVRALENKI